ncbi:hypothetical protein [Epibacterium sp. Ofav1-8]|uniref:hypothetical protein n=1 Tax=Epibacterium sp. Ofav1-8 TaxID=2917735 RepID=UPI001EF50587|nr:hypothetical protein [Epibacterium sp. Ofav1-8]MCG7623189.1 hypothetical protein [Epibacterium sp. Ofav1-8]
MDTNTFSDAIELAGAGLKATDTLVTIAGRIKGLFQSSQPGSDEEMKTLLAELTLQVADAKLANAELKIKLTQMLEAHCIEQQSRAQLDNYRMKKTGIGGIAYAPKNLPDDDPEFHFICPNCYEDGKKAFLQVKSRHLFCARCTTEVPYEPHRGISIV